MFSDIAPTLPKGATSDPIRSPSGFHLIYMEDLRGGEQIVAQTEVRHILVKPSEILTDDQAREMVESLRTRALEGEDFGDLAREYSEDIGLKVCPSRRIRREISAISKPFRTQFGWHILMVEGRREQDMTSDAIRKKAADYLHNRKYQEELDAWLQQIRDEAFVDIK